MKHVLATAVSAAAFSLSGEVAFAMPEESSAEVFPLGEARKIKVLYAGVQGGSRETAFVELLKANFDTVGVIDIVELSTSTAAEYDVVVADWKSMYGKDGYPASEAEGSIEACRAHLPADFIKPVVAVSSVASSLMPRGKLDWL